MGSHQPVDRGHQVRLVLPLGRVAAEPLAPSLSYGSWVEERMSTDRAQWTRNHFLTISPLVRLPECPYPSDGMKMLQKSIPLPAGPLSHACTV